MRIRRSASRLLGSAYSASASAAPPPDAAPPLELPTPPPPPPPHLAPCSALESLGGGGLASPESSSGDPCRLSRSPWDLIAELAAPDPQVEDELVDKYFVHVDRRTSWLLTASMPAASVKQELAAVGGGGARAQRREVVKKAPRKLAMSKEKEKTESETKEKPKVENGEGAAQVWKCKKNDGKRWHCHRTVSSPNALCDYHFYQKRSYCNPDMVSATEVPAAMSKPSSSKPRKKKSSYDFGASEGYYYYAGFGPFRSKRHCRSTTHDSVPPTQDDSSIHDSVPPTQDDSSMRDSVPPKQEDDLSMHDSVPPKQEDNSSMHDSVPPKQYEDESALEDAAPQNQANAETDGTNQDAVHDEVASCDDIAGIAGGDEESSDDDDGLGASVHNKNGNSEPRVGNGDMRRKNPWKRWRKPVKARSLKSLMKNNDHWSEAEMIVLVNGVSKEGLGKWSKVKRDYFPASIRTAVHLKDKWRNLVKACRAQVTPCTKKGNIQRATELIVKRFKHQILTIEAKHHAQKKK